jgi:hypothetical protein
MKSPSFLTSFIIPYFILASISSCGGSGDGKNNDVIFMSNNGPGNLLNNSINNDLSNNSLTDNLDENLNTLNIPTLQSIEFDNLSETTALKCYQNDCHKYPIQKFVSRASTLSCEDIKNLNKNDVKPMIRNKQISLILELTNNIIFNLSDYDENVLSKNKEDGLLPDLSLSTMRKIYPHENDSNFTTSDPFALEKCEMGVCSYNLATNQNDIYHDIKSLMVLKVSYDLSQGLICRYHTNGLLPCDNSSLNLPPEAIINSSEFFMGFYCHYQVEERVATVDECLNKPNFYGWFPSFQGGAISYDEIIQFSCTENIPKELSSFNPNQLFTTYVSEDILQINISINWGPQPPPIIPPIQFNMGM